MCHSKKIERFYSTNADFYNSSIKIGFIFFFSSSDLHQCYHLLGCQAAVINSLFNYFLSALRFSNLICHAKCLPRTIVSGSSLSKLSSRLLWLRSILTTPISLQLNTT